MADPDSSSAQKPLVYGLLYQLNAAFARLHHKMAALADVGIVDLIMQMLTRQCETLHAGANSICSEPCAALKNATASASHSHTTSKLFNQRNPPYQKAAFYLTLNPTIQHTPGRTGTPAKGCANRLIF